MTSARFVFRNAFRNIPRALLTIMSVAFTAFLLLFLLTILRAFTNPPETEASIRRLAVQRSVGLADVMPISHQRRIEALPHVELVTPFSWFGGMYREPKNFFANFAIEADKLWPMFPELRASDEARARFSAMKTAAIVGKKLADRFGWKVGDRVTLTGTIYPVDLDFEIAGIYESNLDENTFYFRYDYFDDSLGEDGGKAGTFWVMADGVDSIPGLIESIDGLFRNSPAETRTMTEKAFALTFTEMIGNVKALIGSISSVVVLTMLIVTGSTMAMQIRERSRETAILKAMGFTRGRVIGMILGEAVAISAVGTLVGYVAIVLLSMVDMAAVTGGMIQVFNPGAMGAAVALAVGVGVGLISGFIPAQLASGQTVNEAMRRLA
jgi:putative ABC transport system permease protein